MITYGVRLLLGLRQVLLSASVVGWSKERVWAAVKKHALNMDGTPEVTETVIAD